MKIGYFDTKELASKDGQRSPFGEQQVRSELLFLLNRIRTAWGRPIIVNSAYRSPEHNRAVGGVENSYHVQGLAADIRPEHQEDLPELQDLCLDLNADGGVGLYDSFVHVDARGFKARWDNCKK
nr:MAG TPA: peptidase [Caudoviricetes sp.]